MAGRPALRIGQHGKITRIAVDKGVWIARCRYRDTDGVTRIVERRSPTTTDQHGKGAEDALVASLADRRAPSGGDITLDTKLTELVTQHIDRIEEDGRAARTLDTYRYTAGQLAKLIAGVRVSEATPPRIDAALRSMSAAHGLIESRRSKTLLRGGLQLAVMAGALPTNPVRDVANQKGKGTGKRKGAPGLTGEQLAELFGKLRVSEFCQTKDLADPVMLLMATGLRRSELLGLRWLDYDRKGATVTVTGKLVRVKGKGLIRVDETKTEAGARVLPLPPFAVEMLNSRPRRNPYYGVKPMMFPSTAGTWRDPDNFNGDWRKAREALGVPDVTSHSFRKSMATMIDDAGLSARVGADHLGHAKVSMTQDVYMSRGRVHTAVADLVESAINVDE